MRRTGRERSRQAVVELRSERGANDDGEDPREERGETAVGKASGGARARVRPAGGGRRGEVVIDWVRQRGRAMSERESGT